jgi:predicted dehydrogenase
MTTEFKPVGMCIVGCGRVADAHIGAIQAQPDVATLLAVVDTNIELARETARKYNIPHAFSNVADLKSVPEVEAAFLLLPNHLHAAATIEYHEAGYHVLVEKPMADTYAQALQMADASEKAGKVLVTGQSRRHGSAIRYVQDNLAKFGRLRSIQASFCMYWPGPQAPWWKTRTPQEGLVLSLIGSHTVDFVQMMFGHKPTRVYAQSSQWRDCWSAEDEAMISLQYPDKRMASVHLSYNQEPFFERYYLLFDGCLVEIRDINTVLVNDEVVFRPPGGEGATLLVANDLFKNQVLEFARAIRGLDNRSALHPQGVALMRVLEASIESSLTGQAIGLDWT